MSGDAPAALPADAAKVRSRPRLTRHAIVHQPNALVAFLKVATGATERVGGGTQRTQCGVADCSARRPRSLLVSPSRRPDVWRPEWRSGGRSGEPNGAVHQVAKRALVLCLPASLVRITRPGPWCTFRLRRSALDAPAPGTAVCLQPADHFVLGDHRLSALFVLFIDRLPPCLPRRTLRLRARTTCGSETCGGAGAGASTGPRSVAIGPCLQATAAR